MKIKVINLRSRLDRLEEFKLNNLKFLPFIPEIVEAFDGRDYTYEQLVAMGYDTDHDWRDPILKRTLTKGEIGCFISHYKLWCECALGTEDFVVLEDDAVFEAPLKDLIEKAPDFDLLYLAHKEMLPEAQVQLGNNYVKPAYAYHTTGYVLTPAGAAKLIEGAPQKHIIPADEYLPRMFDRMEVVGFEKQSVYQQSRNEVGTDVEPSSESDYVRDFETHVLTCGSDLTRMHKLVESAAYQGFQVKNVFHQDLDTWGGGNMEGPGGGQKINLILRQIKDLPDHDVVLFTDAYDVFFAMGLDAIVGKYLGFKSDIVLAAEQYLWPDQSVAFPPTHTKYRYLNSGTFIGRVGELKRFLQPVEDSSDDQLFMQKQFLTGRYNAVLDVECYIFQTNEQIIVVSRDMLYNAQTQCYPCIYHGNGGAEAKVKFEQLYASLYPELKYIMTKDFEVIGNEMLLIDFLTPEQCQEWIDVSEKHGGWNPHPDDKFPSHDIHFKELGLWEDVERHWSKVVAPICEAYWSPYLHYHVRKGFTMKYSADTQKTLGKHTDASLVTGSVKLNDDYQGATLVFPRQNVTNKDIPIGKMILFPGQVTHGHYVDELTEGTKYSATFWTARFKGDYLDPE